MTRSASELTSGCCAEGEAEADGDAVEPAIGGAGEAI